LSIELTEIIAKMIGPEEEHTKFACMYDSKGNIVSWEGGTKYEKSPHSVPLEKAPQCSTMLHLGPVTSTSQSFDCSSEVHEKRRK